MSAAANARRTVILRSVWAILFLLIALAPYVVVRLATQDAAFVGVFVTPLFLAASEIAAIRAIIAGSGVTEVHRRRILGWSLTFIGSALAALVLLLGSYFLAATTYCTDVATVDACVQNIGTPTYACIGAFAVVGALAVFVAPILALVDAFQTGRLLWFLLLLLVLPGVLAAAGSALLPYYQNLPAVLTHLDWLLIARVVSPLLLPLLALLYSLTERESAQFQQFMEAGERRYMRKSE
jgi:hypothetical protein